MPSESQKKKTKNTVLKKKKKKKRKRKRMAEKVPTMLKDVNLQTQETQGTPNNKKKLNKMKTNNNHARHIKKKPLETKDKDWI